MSSPPGCAVCAKKPVDPVYRPFCSRRCADIDLGRWLSDRYAIPAMENEETASDEEDWRPEER